MSHWIDCYEMKICGRISRNIHFWNQNYMKCIYFSTCSSRRHWLIMIFWRNGRCSSWLISSRKMWKIIRVPNTIWSKGSIIGWGSMIRERFRIIRGYKVLHIMRNLKILSMSFWAWFRKKRRERRKISDIVCLCLVLLRVLLGFLTE